MATTRCNTAAAFPLPTTFEFTKARLDECARVYREQGCTRQIEFCDARERGLRAVIYPGGNIYFHSRFFLNRRSKHLSLGRVGHISIEQARAAHRANCVKAAQGTHPKVKRADAITLLDFFSNYYCEYNCRKASFSTDISRSKRMLATFGKLPLDCIDSMMLARFFSGLHKEGLASATITNYLQSKKIFFR